MGKRKGHIRQSFKGESVKKVRKKQNFLLKCLKYVARKEKNQR